MRRIFIGSLSYTSIILLSSRIKCLFLLTIQRFMLIFDKLAVHQPLVMDLKTLKKYCHCHQVPL